MGEDTKRKELKKELVFLILQFLEEEVNWKETVHELEKESGLFFNMRYFEDCVTKGEWDELEKYLSGYTKFDDNEFSQKMFFAIRKQKYFEALDRRDNSGALEILLKDLEVFFSTPNDELFVALTMLLTLPNIRDNVELFNYGDTMSARALMLPELKRLINSNPCFRDKLQFPSLMNSRLRTLIGQSFQWQHQFCKNPNSVPHIKTLFVDHRCGQPNVIHAPSPVKACCFPPIGTHGPSQSAAAPVQSPLPASLADRSAPKTEIVGLKKDICTFPSTAAKELENYVNWKWTEMNEPSQLRSLHLPDSSMPIRVVGLIYANSGAAILALTVNGVHKLWKWLSNEHNPTGKATSALPPQFWQPSSGILMTNDICETNQEDATPCLSLSNNDSYVLSASGGKISLFNMMNFKKLITFMDPPPAATFIALHPKDNNIIAIGMGDSSIRIYNIWLDEAICELRDHQKRVTGLAFSCVLNILVSSGADAQLCVWIMDGWQKQASKFLPNPLGQTRVQFHPDQRHLIAVHGRCIAIYETPQLKLQKEWNPHESSGSITDAAYSCDGQSIYVSFEDGSVRILTSSTFQLKCQINCGAYLLSRPSAKVYPVVIAAHPSQPHQFALGLSDGGVHILEPPEDQGQWGNS